MYNIVFYQNNSGVQPVKEYLTLLAAKRDKDSRIKLNKIRDYIQVLRIHGTRAGEPYVKHINDELWELRPLRDRLFFFCWQGNSFVLVHHFVKKTKKTPKREIEQAKRNMRDFIERMMDDGE